MLDPQKHALGRTARVGGYWVTQLAWSTGELTFRRAISSSHPRSFMAAGKPRNVLVLSASRARKRGRAGEWVRSATGLRSRMAPPRPSRVGLGDAVSASL